MHKLIPVITEKSMLLAGKGKYTFIVDNGLNKGQIKELVGYTFDVHVTTVKTINLKASSKRNIQGKIISVRAKKKAIVTLKDKEKIDLFEIKEEK